MTNAVLAGSVKAQRTGTQTLGSRCSGSKPQLCHAGHFSGLSLLVQPMQSHCEQPQRDVDVFKGMHTVKWAWRSPADVTAAQRVR